MQDKNSEAAVIFECMALTSLQEIISKMLYACVNPWDSSNCVLYLHQPIKEVSKTMGYNFLPSLLSELENSSEYTFLQSSSEFCELIAKYKGILNTN